VQLKRNLRTTPGVTHEALARFGEFCPTTPLLQILGKTSLAIASLCDGERHRLPSQAKLTRFDAVDGLQAAILPSLEENLNSGMPGSRILDHGHAGNFGTSLPVATTDCSRGPAFRLPTASPASFCVDCFGSSIEVSSLARFGAIAQRLSAVKADYIYPHAFA
jgi:hypothetical protein